MNTPPDQPEGDEPSREDALEPVVDRALPAKAENSEIDQEVNYWANLIAQTGDRILMAKFDKRLWTDPERKTPRPTITGDFETYRLNKENKYWRADFGPDLTDRSVSKTIERIEEDVRRRGHTANVLLFYTNEQIGKNGTVHFAYSCTFAPEYSLDNRTGLGDPMTMYGQIPVGKLQEFWQSVARNPKLVDDVFKRTYAWLIRERWIQRRQSDTLVVGYITGGPGSGGHTFTAREVLERGGFERRFSEPVGEVPVS